MDRFEKIIFCGESDMGLLRTNNEDAFILERMDEHTVLAAAIDGVGGYEGGEVAAAIAKDEIPRYLREFNRVGRLSLLKEAVVSANNAIFAQRLKDVHISNMSCVLTSVLIDTYQKVIDLVHVGDTRLYQYYRGALVKLSHDHSFVGCLEENNDITEYEAMHHPSRNVISRSVGNEHHEVDDPDFLEANEFPLLPNSILLLCSDGLTDMITRAQIISIIEQNISLEEKAKALINAANEAGGKDNITVVLVEYQEEEAPNCYVTKATDEDNNEKNGNNEDNDKGQTNRNEKAEKINTKNIIPILFGCIVALLCACIALGIFSKISYDSARVFEKQINILEDSIVKLPIDKQESIVNDSIQDIARNQIERYTEALEENDFETISQLFAPYVQRYIRTKYKSNEEVVGKHKEYDTKFGIRDKSVNVRWQTFNAMQLPNGEVFVDFIEDYTIDRIDTTKKLQYVLHYQVTLDPDGKIVSIYYDEVDENK